VVSPASDIQPAYSPDGRRIAFCSTRFGERYEIWVSDSDGTEARQLTDGLGEWQCSPHWSPDGRQVAFDSQAADGNSHVWTIDADGGPPRQITSGPGSQTHPTFSRDGRWVYFSWRQDSGHDIWRIGADGRPVERLTKTGTVSGVFEEADAGHLLYQASWGNVPVLELSLADGSTRQVVACAGHGAGIAARAEGVYYVGCEVADPQLYLHTADGADRPVGRLELLDYISSVDGQALAPNGKTILYGRHVTDGANLMVVENFK